MVHVRPHSPLTAPAYGNLARRVYLLLGGQLPGSNVKLRLSRMAGGTAFETNTDLAALLDTIVADPKPSIVFLTAAVCGWEPQWGNECGSHECGQNTSDGLTEVVYLDNHGPNTIFPKGIDPAKVIDFIDNNFDLTWHTGQGVAA